jgi:ferredoxin
MAVSCSRCGICVRYCPTGVEGVIGTAERCVFKVFVRVMLNKVEMVLASGFLITRIWKEAMRMQDKVYSLLLEMSPSLRILPPLCHRLPHFPLRPHHDNGYRGMGEAIF